MGNAWQKRPKRPSSVPARPDDEIEESGTRLTPISIPRDKAERLLRHRSGFIVRPEPLLVDAHEEALSAREIRTTRPPRNVAEIPKVLVTVDADFADRAATLLDNLSVVDNDSELLRHLSGLPDDQAEVRVLVDCRSRQPSPESFLGWMSAIGIPVTVVLWGHPVARGAGQFGGVRWVYCSAEAEPVDVTLLLLSM